MPGQSSPAIRLPMSAPSPTGDRGWVAVFTTRPRGQAARACVPPPSGSRRAPPSVRTTRWQGMATAIVFARTRRAHRTHRLRCSDALGDVGIGRRRPRRNLAQRLPHALLERGPTHVEGEIETEGGRLDETDHLGHQLLEARVAADQGGAGKAVLQIAHERLGLVPERNRAHAFVGGGHQDRAQRALADREADRWSPPRPPESPWASCPKSPRRRRRTEPLELKPAS